MIVGLHTEVKVRSDFFDENQKMSDKIPIRYSIYCMKKHHTKNKGDLGVLKAQVALCEQGYLTLIPNTEHSPFDLVAYKDGKFFRIQVKYRSASKGKIEVKFASIWTDKSGIHIIPVDKDEIDMYCLYCPDTDRCYWIDPKKFDCSVTLRLEDTKNNQQEGVNMASDFEKMLR